MEERQVRRRVSVYLYAHDSVTEARQGLARHFTFYNQGRPHSALDGQTPDMVYFSMRALARGRVTCTPQSVT
jgi:putative transposase